MQVENKERRLIFPKLKDGTSYLILFLLSIAFMEFLIAAFILPIKLSFPLVRPDIEAEINSGILASSYAKNHILYLSSIVGQVIGYVFFICIIGVICFNVFKVDFLNFKLRLGKNIGLVFAFGVMIYVVDIVVSNIYAILGDTGTSMNQLMIYGALSSPVKGVTILLTVLLAPIVEEIIYRKFMFGAIHNKLKLPIWGAGLLSAAIFALIHVSSSLDQLVYFPQYFAMALVLVAAYITSGQNIYFSIGVHIFNNAISIIIWILSTTI